MVVWTAKPFQQCGNPFQPQDVATGGQHGQPVKLRLNFGVGGVGVVRH